LLSIQQIDQLAGAIVLDRRLGKEFLENRVEALEKYNQHYAFKHGEKPIHLSEEEKKAILSVKARDIADFFDQLVAIAEHIQKELSGKNPRGDQVLPYEPVFRRGSVA
jgi:hypothetical protein